jgi:hypothetical protein
MNEIEIWWAERLKGSDHFRGEEWSQTRIPGLLPHRLPQEFITFFTTSEFELPIFKDFEIIPGKYKTQFQALSDLYKITNELKIHLVIRRHPNSVDWQGSDREFQLWNEFKNLPNLTYIGPKEKIDSIELAIRSKQVFTYKSSVGIESIWLGVSAFAMGPARWAWTNEIRAWDENQLRFVILNQKENDKQHAIRWAEMMINMDYPNKIFKSIEGNYARTATNTYHLTKLDIFIELLVVNSLFAIVFVKQLVENNFTKNYLIKR